MKSKIVILITSLVLCITCIVVGLCVGISINQTVNTPTEPPITDPVPTLPEELPDLNVPKGTYYFIGSTHTTWELDDNGLQNIENHAITIIIGDSKASIGADIDASHAFTLHNANDIANIAYSNGNTVVLDDNGAKFQSQFNIDGPHDEVWYETYGRKEAPWTCTYDAETQTLTISHNSDFAMFKLFEDATAYVNYLTENFAITNGVAVAINPEPINNSTEQKGQ